MNLRGDFSTDLCSTVFHKYVAEKGFQLHLNREPKQRPEG